MPTSPPPPTVPTPAAATTTTTTAASHPSSATAVTSQLMLDLSIIELYFQANANFTCVHLPRQVDNEVITMADLHTTSGPTSLSWTMLNVTNATDICGFSVGSYTLVGIFHTANTSVSTQENGGFIYEYNATVNVHQAPPQRLRHPPTPTTATAPPSKPSPPPLPPPPPPLLPPGAISQLYLTSAVTFSDLLLSAFDDPQFNATFRQEFLQQVHTACAVTPVSSAITAIVEGSTEIFSLFVFNSTDKAPAENLFTSLVARPSDVFTDAALCRVR
ncbi:hypothetical protein CYMTET_8244 [Cymbomonas tetramitiformis]|uniref:Uncharacterized protein n=1 Tax=Cymbomonas tetramitiformis TaxID=36881 RepID=A0AAE0LG96_9CHLO|nr:hypothetical protein CYMTET_8244 [Cymbomonas tetramitiformis]